MTFKEWWASSNKFYTRKWPNEEETAKVAWDAAIKAAQTTMSAEAYSFKEESKAKAEEHLTSAINQLELRSIRATNKLFSWREGHEH